MAAYEISYEISYDVMMENFIWMGLQVDRRLQSHRDRKD